MSNSQPFRHILVIEDKKGRRIVTLENTTYSIGRDSRNSIVIYDNHVSRYHATMIRVTDFQNNNNCFYRIMDGDLQGKRSTNGLIVNGKATLSQELKHGDLIRFGGKSKAIYHIIQNNPEIKGLTSENHHKKVPSKATIREESKKTVSIENPELEKLNQEELVRLASFPELSPNPIIEINWQGKITYINGAATVKFKDIEANHPILAGLLTNSQNRQGNLFVREVKIGTEVFEQYVHYLSNSQLIRSYIFDFTKRKQAEVALRESEQRYRAVVRQTSDGILIVNAKTNQIIESNQAYCKLLGYSQAEILNLTLNDIVKVNENNVEKNIQRVVNEKIDLLGTSKHIKKDGSLVNVEVSISLICYSAQEVFCLVVRNLKNSAIEENQDSADFYDVLTGIANRTLFNEQLTTALANANRHGHLMAIIVIDIEQFKNINHAFGHQLGDEILKAYAQRLKNNLRTGDTVSRWGSDEFVILLPRVVHNKDIATIAQRLLKILEQPLEIEEHSIELKSSIGIAVYPEHGNDAQTIVKKALAALQQIKKQHRSNYGFYSNTTNQEVAGVLRVEQAIQKAIENQELSLYYQPLFDSQSKQIVAMEALLRWKHPKLGLMLPEKFLPMVQETDLIVPISEWVLNTACQQNLAWIKTGVSPIPVIVNFSKQEFQRGNIVVMVTQVLEKTKLDPYLLELDIKENLLMDNEEIASCVIKDLLQLGIGISIDDFGLASLPIDCLRKFSCRRLKISQSLITKLEDKPEELAIINAAIALGQGFNVQVVGEGVETEKQLELLRKLGCQYMQGYYFSKPLPAEEATLFLSENANNLSV